MTRRNRFIAICLVLAALLIEWQPSPRGQQRLADVAAAVRAAAARGQNVPVIVSLRVDGYRAEGLLTATQVAGQRAAMQNALQRVLGGLPAAIRSRARTFDFIPFFSTVIDGNTLLQLEVDPDVVSIQEDGLLSPVLAQSVPLVGGTNAWSMGYTGAGWTVAILDTGVETSHSFLSGKTVSEACYSNAGNAGAASVCPGGVGSTTAPGSGVNCPSSVSGCYHGTHVAGIAAGKGASFSGVAKDATIMAFQVFTNFTGDAQAYFSDILAGLNRVYALRGSFNIASVNMSLGGGQYASQASCDAASPSFKAAVDLLRSVNIASVIASGNNGYTDSMSFPGCISTAVSVGSTNKSDVVSSFSNSASWLNLVAPGESINSSLPGNTFGSLSGTSMATPHVAGAWAVLRQRFPGGTVPMILNALASRGVPITDARQGRVAPRIKVDSALTSFSTVKPPRDFDGDGKSDFAVYRPATGEWWIRNQAAVQWGQAADVPVTGDYDGNGTSDIAVYRPSNGTWWVRNQFSVQWGLPGDLPVPADYNGDHVTDVAVFRASTGTWWIRNQASLQWGAAGDIPVPGDYTGDGVADIAIYRPSTGEWWVHGMAPVAWGAPGDVPVPADYNADGVIDVAVFRPSTGTWWIRGQNSVQWGQPDDVPVPGDFDGDGITDIAVFHPSTGVWSIRNQGSVQWGAGTDWALPRPASTGFRPLGDYSGDGSVDPAVYRPSTHEWWVRGMPSVNWGGDNDVPVPGDYNGDTVTDIAVFRPSTGQWLVRNQFTIAWGGSGDLPVPADYNGDGVTDVAIFRPSTGEWWVRNVFTTTWGGSGDIPVPGDYNGDGIGDIGIYRPSTNEWWIPGQAVVTFGQPGDIPVPGDYNGDTVTDIALFRPSTGQWLVRNQFTMAWGGSGDIPVPGDYNGDGVMDLAIFRPSTGAWWVRGQYTVTFGANGDIPVIRPIYASPAATGTATFFGVQPGYTDNVPHQLIRTNADRLYVFAASQPFSSAVNAYWTTAPGLPGAGTDFGGSAQVVLAANPISVSPAYDGAGTIHVVANLQNGTVVDVPFDLATNTFRAARVLVADSATVAGDYEGSSGVTTMVDLAGRLHVAYWSSANQIVHAAYSYTSATDSLAQVSAPVRVDTDGSARHPSLAISPLDNSATVAWVSLATTPRHILARVRDASGVWGAVQSVSQPTVDVWTSTSGGIDIDQGPSLVITTNGTKHLTYIENYDATGDYGAIHHVADTGGGWVDAELPAYAHNPVMAVNSAGEVYIIGHGHPNDASPVCQNMDDMCVRKRNSDGTWGPSTLFASHPAGQSFDASPSVKWSVVGWNRPETIEFLFFQTPYATPTVYYGRL